MVAWLDLILPLELLPSELASIQVYRLFINVLYRFYIIKSNVPNLTHLYNNTCCSKIDFQVRSSPELLDQKCLDTAFLAIPSIPARECNPPAKVLSISMFHDFRMWNDLAIFNVFRHTFYSGLIIF